MAITPDADDVRKSSDAKIKSAADDANRSKDLQDVLEALRSRIEAIEGGSATT